MADIGKELEEIEVVPLSTPAESPVAPSAPAPTPSTPAVPQKEPVPA